MESFVIPFRELDLEQIPIVGGKNANLGTLLRHLSEAGIRVPDGFAITADAFRRHIAAAQLEPIYGELDALDIGDVEELREGRGPDPRAGSRGPAARRDRDPGALRVRGAVTRLRRAGDGCRGPFERESTRRSPAHAPGSR